MKLKINKLTIIILVITILLSSCKKEEAKIINAEYNFSRISVYDINIKQSDNLKSDLVDNLLTTKVSSKLSDLNFLSIGLKFSSDDVEIFQMKINSDLYNWTFVPDRILENNGLYFGKKSLLIPNNVLSDDLYDVSVYYRDGSIKNTTIESINTPIESLNIDVKIFDKYLFINLNTDEEFKDVLNSSINIDEINALEETNYMISLYRNNKLILERELFLNDFQNLIESKYLKDADKLIIEKKISNNTISGNLYYINYN